MKKYRVFNIIWDVDNEIDLEYLPNEMIVGDVDDCHISGVEDLEYFLSEEISNQSGFCHKGFEYEEIF